MRIGIRKMAPIAIVTALAGTLFLRPGCGGTGGLESKVYANQVVENGRKI